MQTRQNRFCDNAVIMKLVPVIILLGKSGGMNNICDVPSTRSVPITPMITDTQTNSSDW